MNPVTAIRLAFGAIFVGGYLVFQLGIAGQMSQVSKALSGEQAVFEGGSFSETKGLPNKVGWVGEKMNGMLNIGMRNKGQEVKALMNPDLYNEDRTLSFDMLVTLDDVLREGENAPPAELEQLMVEARAGDLVMDECARSYIGSLVRGCALMQAETERVYLTINGETFSKPPEDLDSAAVWQIKAKLAFLPTILPGDTSDKAGWAIESSFRGGRATSLTVDNTVAARAQARKDLLMAAKLECEAVRDTYGTCVLNSLRTTEKVTQIRGKKGEPDAYKAVVQVDPSFYWLRAPTIPEDNTAIEMAMATNPALPVMGKYFPPTARSPKLFIEHNQRKERAEEQARRKAEKLEKARLAAIAEANGEPVPEPAEKPKLKGGNALNGGSNKFGGGALNSGGVKFKSVD